MSRRQKRFPRFQQAFRAARTQIFLFLTEKYGFEHRTKPQSWHGSCEGENNKCAQQGRSARRRHATNDNIELKSGTRTAPAFAVSRLKTRTSRPQGGQSQHRAEARCAPASLLCFFGALRGVLRRKKARQGIRSTPTGLKRLKTQNTASYDCNVKWERLYLALPNLYTSANSFRKKNSSTLPILGCVDKKDTH